MVMSLHGFCNSVHLGLGLGLEQTASHSDCVYTHLSLFLKTERPCQQRRDLAVNRKLERLKSPVERVCMQAVGTGEADGLLLISRSENQVHFSFFLDLQVFARKRLLHKVVLLWNGGGGDDDWRGELERDCGSPREGFLIPSPSPWGKSSISERYEFSGFWRFVEHAILSSILHLFCSMALGEK